MTSGLLARLILGVERGVALDGHEPSGRVVTQAVHGVRFWDQRPYTRIVTWGRDFERTTKYLAQNTLEALGFIEYTPRVRGTTKRGVFSTA